MSQDQIIKALEDKELTIKEIQELVDVNLSAMKRALHQMIKYHEVEKKYKGKVPVYRIKITINKKK